MPPPGLEVVVVAVPQINNLNLEIFTDRPVAGAAVLEFWAKGLMALPQLALQLTDLQRLPEAEGVVVEQTVALALVLVEAISPAVRAVCMAPAAGLDKLKPIVAALAAQLRGALVDQAQSVLSGPEALVRSHQLVRGIYESLH